ncbi:carotenoid oxygenase family protein [Actinomadura rubrisoli]|uniref:Dioxygenase n=1 Tax=Actinomadura rubrisoli TaxID=2530368 RepID=A0A4R5BZL7_9ACTN|nr:carotenoid oxygenase family protein [Actinomadura rubrisoli]TDD91835.1 dioxygenase [Actinomadura rubrisoli]
MTKPYISGHYTPAVDEISATDLPVRGTIPPELEGRYLRNGHNAKPGVTPTHWFRGSGMIHGVRIRGGRAEWYRNRWVHTTAFDDDAPLFRPDGSLDLAASAAATHIIEYGGRLLALQEVNLPWELSPELDTIGTFDFGGTLKTAMTAHTKEDPVTGDLHFLCYSPFPPHLVYYVASPAGEIVRNDVIEGAGPALMHDFAITGEHVLFIDFPVVFNPAEQSGIPYRWSDDYPARLGVMPRTGPPRVQWFEVEPSALLHTTNAHVDAAGRIVLDGPRYDRAAWETSWKWWVGAPGYAPVPVAGVTSHRWTLDTATGKAAEERTDDLVTEFPTIDNRRIGLPNRHSYALAFPGGGLDGWAVVKYDHQDGTRRLFDLGRDRLPSEPYFVPAEGGTDDDHGYLMTITSDLASNSSEMLILDAGDLHERAAIQLPRRVPAGIHGSWIPDSDLH